MEVPIQNDLELKMLNEEKEKREKAGKNKKEYQEILLKNREIL